MINIATLGCWATRNCCNYFDSTCVRHVIHAPRISLIALSGDSFKYSENVLEILDSSQREIVSRDLKKTFWNDIARTKPNLLLVDFAEEVYDLIATNDGRSFLTNSPSLGRIRSSLVGHEFSLIARDSGRFEELWGEACKSFLEKAQSLGIKPVLVRLYVPDRYISENTTCSYDDGLLDKIQRLNLRLDRCYSVFAKSIACEEISIPPASQIIKSSNGKKIGIADYTQEISELIATEIASKCEIQKHLIPSPDKKVDMYMKEFARLLEAGDIPTVYELYTRGRSLKLSGDEKGAVRCERLISLLRNSSVPLTADLGKVQFGNSVTINENAIIGDHVTIGANVTVGGAGARRDKHGVTRVAPIIRNRVYIATGAKVLGGIEIGSHCIIGANAVVTKDIPDFSVVAGIPGKVIATITPDNLHKYKGYLYKGLALPDVRKLMFGS